MMFELCISVIVSTFNICNLFIFTYFLFVTHVIDEKKPVLLYMSNSKVKKKIYIKQVIK